MFEESFIPVGGLRIQYYHGGSTGPAVVLLHGGGTDSGLLSWKLTAPALMDRYRVYLPNWPGYGESTPLPGEYATADLVQVLGGILDALGLEDAALVGISMGGGVALGYGLDSQDRVRKLVLVDSYGLQTHAPAHLLSYALVRLPFAIPLSWKLVRSSKWITRWALQAIFRDPAAVTDELVEEVFEAVRKPGIGQAFYGWQRGELGVMGLRTNYLDRLGRLAVPTLLIQGREDPLVPWESAQRAAGLINDAQLVLFDGCGHWPQREKPLEFNRVLVDFLG